MLTYPLTTIIDTSISAIGFTGDVVFEYRFDSICTNFDHDASSTSFTGNLAILGGVQALLYTSGLLSSTLSSLFTNPIFFTVVNGVYDTVNSTGSALLTANISGDFALSDELSATALQATLTLPQLTLIGSSSVFGIIGGDVTILPGASDVTASLRQFSLDVGAVCF
ncbi:MAG: hypothetical protein AB7P22_01745 [Vicinamibacterales bacterium]